MPTVISLLTKESITNFPSIFIPDNKGGGINLQIAGFQEPQVIQPLNTSIDGDPARRSAYLAPKNSALAAAFRIPMFGAGARSISLAASSNRPERVAPLRAIHFARRPLALFAIDDAAQRLANISLSLRHSLSFPFFLLLFFFFCFAPRWLSREFFIDLAPRDFGVDCCFCHEVGWLFRVVFLC